MHNVSLIKWLYQKGYRQKIIGLITGYNQSYISKNCNSSKPYLPTIDTANEEQLRRKAVIDIILECKILRHFEQIGFCEQDKIYIKLLDYCLVDRDIIRKLYRTTSMYKISKALRLDKDKIKEFDPMGLNIEQEDWELLLEQIFK